MAAPRVAAAPAGDVTLMFTDIEGSTRGWQMYEDRFHAALQIHNALLRQAIERHNGYEVKTIGDSFMVAFDNPLAAAACALDMQQLIESESFADVNGLRIRIGLHTADMEPTGGDYFGTSVNRAARIANAAHGGLILLSEETARRLEAAMPEGAALVDHGFHRLKDLSANLQLFQLSHPDLPERAYPALRTLAPDMHNFPAQVTSFVGREREIREVSALLNKPKNRLITITGPGGTGKTRLSLQVAAECVQQYRNGVWLVELAGVSRAQDVPAAVALALNLPISHEGDARAQIFAYLKERTCLLVMDNFEQVVDAARFLSDLLRHCPHVTVMVSSRELLQVAGETDYPLAPLDLPIDSVTLKTWAQYASLRLFVERCQSVRPNFAITAENLADVATICRRLEGLPLAVELTSALMRGMTPQQIVPRLQDRFRLLASSRRDLDPRQRSLRGAIDWSYDLLHEDERALFAELSIFVGGFSLEAVEAVCETPLAFDLVYSLRDKSLLRSVEVHGEMRYSMLETLREYACEKLGQTGTEPELSARHAAYYLEQAQQWSEHLEGSGDAALAQQRMTQDRDNMFAGMDWAITGEKGDMVAAYGRALARFFLAKGLPAEGEQRLTVAEQWCRKADDLPALALLLLQRGRIAFRQSRSADAKRYYEESYALSKELGNTPRLVPPLINLGKIAWSESDYGTAKTLWEEGLALARETAQSSYEATLLANLGILASDQGEFKTAARHFEDALSIHRQEHNEKSMATALMNSAGVLARQKNYLSAYEHMLESRNLFVRLGRRQEIALTTVHIGHFLLEMQRLEEAEHNLQTGLLLAVEIKDAWSEMYGLTAQGCLAGRYGARVEAFTRFREALQIARQLGDRSHIGKLLQYAGDILIIHAQPHAAYTAFTLALREFSALVLWDAREVEVRLAQIRPTLDASVLEQLESSAATLTIEDILSADK